MVVRGRGGLDEGPAGRLGGGSDRGVGGRVARRDRVEALVDGARYLGERDRALVEQVYRYGASVAGVARLTGEPVWRVRRRLRRLVARVNDPLFGFLVMYGDVVPAGARRTAEMVVFRGLSLRRAAALTGRSLHRVRGDLGVVRALARV